MERITKEQRYKWKEERIRFYREAREYQKQLQAQNQALLATQTSFQKLGQQLANAGTTIGDMLLPKDDSVDPLAYFTEALLDELPMKPTADTWVMKDSTGKYVRIKVSEMTDPHVWRWIRYFRRKYREAGFSGSNDVLDAYLRAHIVTAPAIFAAARTRGILYLDSPPKPNPPPAPPKYLGNPVVLATSKPATMSDPAPGVRRISLNEDDDA